MSTRSVSIHPVVAEIDEGNRRDLERQAVAYKCDQCHNPGTNLWGTSWLCAFCWLKAANEMYREAYGKAEP